MILESIFSFQAFAFIYGRRKESYYSIIHQTENKHLRISKVSQEVILQLTIETAAKRLQYPTAELQLITTGLIMPTCFLLSLLNLEYILISFVLFYNFIFQLSVLNTLLNINNLIIIFRFFSLFICISYSFKYFNVL